MTLKKRLTVSAVEEALPKCCGNLAAVGRLLGFSRQAVSALVKKTPALAALALDQRETAIDEVEDVLLAAAKQGQPWAVCFYLKTQAKHRGYVERGEISGPDGGPIKSEGKDVTRRIEDLLPAIGRAIDSEARLAAAAGGDPEGDGA